MSSHQGGGDGLHPGCRGARHEGAGGNLASLEWAAELVAGRRCPGRQSAHGAAAAVAVRAVRLRRAVRSPAAPPLTPGGPAGRGPAPPALVPGALRPTRRPPGLQHPALLPGGVPRPSRAVVVQLREAGAADRRLGRQAAPARAASPPARAAPLFRGTGAPRWQPAPVAGPGRRRPADTHRRGGRRDQTAALRPARRGGRESSGHHDGPARGARAARHPGGPLHRRRAPPPTARSGPRSAGPWPGSASSTS